MPDRYENFADLARRELEGRDYRIHAVARAWAERFDWRAVAPRYLDLYAEVLREPA